MKILVTGMTPLQRGSTRRSIQKLDVPAGVVDAMRALGHTVDWTGYTFTDPLPTGYDLHWVSVAHNASIGSRHGLGPLSLLNMDTPTVVFFDDWKLRNILNDFRSLERHRMKWLGRQAFGQNFYTEDWSEIEKHEDVLVGIAERFLQDDPAPNWIYAMPAYGWGDLSIASRVLTTRDDIVYRLDPSPLTQAPDRIDWEKSNRWMLSILTDVMKWVDKQDVTWPVDYFGNKRHGIRLKTENEIMEEYARRWGAMAPPYSHAGSGWFRTRFQYAAAGGSVLVTDSKDAKELGPAYDLTYDMVESATDTELRRMAENQLTVLTSYLPTYEQFVQNVDTITRAAVRRGVIRV